MTDIYWQTLPITHPLIAAHLAIRVPPTRGMVMIAKRSRFRGCRMHLTLYTDKTGYFVKVGTRGHDKRYLGECEVTYLDGDPTLYRFVFKTDMRNDADITSVDANL